MLGEQVRGSVVTWTQKDPETFIANSPSNEPMTPRMKKFSKENPMQHHFRIYGHKHLNPTGHSIIVLVVEVRGRWDLLLL